ncbi:MAG TPA: 2-phospho-L-lactate guanylyltransferase [Rhizomicrobium sp.]|jgi:2-phospho-L-lactate guanylyltransferase
MTLCVIVPVKPFGSAKSRLSPVLAPAARRALAQALFDHTMEALAGFSAPALVMVVSRSAAALHEAAARGFVPLKESRSSGLNTALAQAAAHAGDLGASRILILPTDLPLLGRDDLDAMAACDCAIAPDQHLAGTNALVWPTRIAPRFHFGANSFARHLAFARAMELDPEVVRRQGLACDVDLPGDLSFVSRNVFAAAAKPGRRRAPESGSDRGPGRGRRDD